MGNRFAAPYWLSPLLPYEKAAALGKAATVISFPEAPGEEGGEEGGIRTSIGCHTS